MSPEKQRIKIAEACPPTLVLMRRGIPVWRDKFEYDESSPKPQHVEFDPLNDLNAMREAEKVLEGLPDGEDYAAHLCRIVLDIDIGDDLTVCLNLWALRRLAKATAAQRAEAFLRTLNLWEE